MDKILLIILFGFLSLVFAAKNEAHVDIYFAHGFGVDSKFTDKSVHKIMKKYKSHNSLLYKSVGEWKVAYNTTHGITIDLYEAMIQKIYEDKPGKSLIPFIWNAGSLPTGLNYAFKGLISKILKKLPKAQSKAFASKQAKFLAKESVTSFKKVNNV